MNPLATCPQCRAKGFIIRGYDNLKGRPEFFCMCCEHTWTYGDDGGPYYDQAIKCMEQNSYLIPKKPNMDKDGFNADFIRKWA